MDYLVLGPLELLDGNAPVQLGGAKQRALLAYLLLRANEVASNEELIDVLWGEDPPETATHALHVYVHKLRKLLGDREDSLVKAGRGYMLRIEPDRLDLNRFLERSEAARRTLALGRVDLAATQLREALALWRGEPLSDLPYDGFPPHEIARLAELRLAATEDRIDADLVLGRHADLVGELRSLVASNPLRERLRGQQMLALYRSGRQAEALQVYRGFQRTLGEELGIDPGGALQDLERRILTHDPDLDPAPPAAEQGVAPDAPNESPTRRRRARLPVAVAALVLLPIVVAVTLVRDGVGDAAPPSEIGPDSVGQIDPATPALIASTPTTGTGAGPVVFAEGSAWVANTLSGTVARVDPATDVVVRTVPTGGAPTDIAAGEGAIWVLNGLDGEVVAIDPATSSVSFTTSVPPGAGGIAVGSGFVWVTNTFETTLSKLNPRDGVVVTTILLGPPGSGSPAAVAVGSDAVWVGDGLAPTLWKVDPAADVVVAMPGLRGVASAITVGTDGRAWVASYDENIVSVVDPVSLGSTSYAVGGGPSALAIGAGSVWVVERLDGSVSRIDPATGGAEGTIAVGEDPAEIAIGGGSVWVSRSA